MQLHNFILYRPHIYVQLIQFEASRDFTLFISIAHIHVQLLNSIIVFHVYMQLIQFEAFRDLIKYANKGLPEEVGLGLGVGFARVFELAYARAHAHTQAGIEAAQEESLVIR